MSTNKLVSGQNRGKREKRNDSLIMSSKSQCEKDVVCRPDLERNLDGAIKEESLRV